MSKAPSIHPTLFGPVIQTTFRVRCKRSATVGLRVILDLLVQVAAPSRLPTRLSALEQSDRPEWVDKRPSAKITMRLLSLDRGAIHGYRYDYHKARNTVEQR